MIDNEKVERVSRQAYDGWLVLSTIGNFAKWFYVSRTGPIRPQPKGGVRHMGRGSSFVPDPIYGQMVAEVEKWAAEQRELTGAYASSLPGSSHD